MKTPSRQVLWQRTQKALGNCLCCAKPSPGTSYCNACATRIFHSKTRRPPKSAWLTVNCSLPTKTIAANLNVSIRAVYHQRPKHQPKHFSHITKHLGTFINGQYQ